MKFMRLTSLEDVKALIKEHNEESEYVVLDLETTGLDPFTDRILDVVLSRPCSRPGGISFPASFLDALKGLTRPVVCHNFRFDFHFLHKRGVKLDLLHDTMLLDHLINENKSHGLDAIVKDLYKDNYKEVFWSKYKNYEEAPEEEALEYACKDVHYTGLIYAEYVNIVPKELSEHVRRLALSLYQTEIQGVNVDLDYLVKLGTDLFKQTLELKTKLRECVSRHIDYLEEKYYSREQAKRKTDKGKSNVKRPEFNFDSSSQLQELIYDELCLPVCLSKEKRRTVDDAALEFLEDQHAFITLLREYRGKQKVYTSFIEGTIERLRDGRIYPSLNVNGTVTGRISSSAPNLQQLPRSGGVRRIFCAERGYCYLGCDYKQLEVTLAAHFSLDENLLKVVNEGVSLHDITAKALGIDRNQAKTVNFAVQYGAGENKISKILSCSRDAAKEALWKYWSTYSGLKDAIDRVHAQVDSGEDIVNPFGRHRRFELTSESGHFERERAKRQAFNSLVQGFGADLTNRAFYLISEDLRQSGHGRGLFPIHDELLIEVKLEYATIYEEKLKQVMVQVGKEFKLNVDLSVDCSGPMSAWED